MPLPLNKSTENEYIGQKTLARLDEKLQDLPMLPVVVTKLISINPDSDEYFDKLLGLAESDPPFAARILNMANSASSHPTKQISKLSSAITRIGSKSIANLVSTMAVMRVFVPTTEGQRFLWAHAIEVAICSRMIARHKRLGKLSEEAYLVGLLHDIGHFIMFDKSPQELARVEATNWWSPQDVIKAELDICGFTHPELGWHICRHWEIPDLVSTIVRNHHIYNSQRLHEQGVSDEVQELIRIVQLGDMISTTLFRDPEWLQLDHEALEARLLEDCIHPGWTAPPIPIPVLATQLERIHEESQAIIKELCLFPT